MHAESSVAFETLFYFMLGVFFFGSFLHGRFDAIAVLERDKVLIFVYGGCMITILFFFGNRFYFVNFIYIFFRIVFVLYEGL